VGLVLGAGGITGVAWLIGALEALREGTGWDPATADVIAGTSAGAVVAAVLPSGVPLPSLLAFADDPELLDDAIRRATEGRAREGRGLPWPGSLALGATALLATTPQHGVSALAGFLPRGQRPTDEIRGLIHDAVSQGWPDHTELWLHASDYRSGRRVTFGSSDAPEAELADAVAASCAVPGYYQPVRIGGRRYVDGGLRSFLNADALLDAGCDVVICLSPFSTSVRGPLLDTAVFGPARRATAMQGRREVEALRAAGMTVGVIEPSSQDLRAMGLNPMERSRSRHVMQTAAASVAQRLPGLLAGIELPGGAPVHAAAALAA
jgi:NTE family protein